MKETEVKPTWMFFKRHSITGMKYFGCTTKYRARNYDGSGTYWSNHIKKYGRKFVVTDLLIGPYTNKEELRNLALWMSVEMDIVNSKEWANQVPEDGMAIGGRGKIWDKERHEKGSGFTGKKHTDEWCENHSKMMTGRSGFGFTGENNPMYGKSVTEFMTEDEILLWKTNIGNALRGVKRGPLSIEHKAKISLTKKGIPCKGTPISVLGKEFQKVYEACEYLKISRKVLYGLMRKHPQDYFYSTEKNRKHKHKQKQD